MPAPPDVRLVAIDLDGTLLDDSKRISPQTVRAISGLPARGIHVVIASARPPRSVRHIYHLLGLTTRQINYNGAMIWDELRKKVIFHQPMTGATVRSLVDLGRREFPGMAVTCEIMDRWYTDRADQPYTTETGRLFRPDVVAPLDQFCHQEITKLLLLGESSWIDEIEKTLIALNRTDISIVRTDPQLIQIMDKKVSKAMALKRVATHYNIPMEQVMAIGDAPNDVGMLQLAGVAIAMDNAHPRVKAEADWIAPSNNDHGVYAALVKFGVCEA